MSDVDLNGRHVSGVAMCFFLPNYVILLITSALNGYGVVGGGLAWVFGVGGGGYWSEETSSIICESWVCLGIESNPYGKLVIGERFVAGLVSRIMCWVVSHIRPRVLKVDGYVCVCVTGLNNCGGWHLQKGMHSPCTRKVDDEENVESVNRKSRSKEW